MIKKVLKYLLAIFFISGSLQAGLVDGVSILVNNTPITLYEISEYSQKFHISTQEAVKILIQNKIEQNLIKKYNIEATDDDIENEMEKMSSASGMSIMDFKNYLEQNGIDLDKYKKDLAKKIKQEKLYQKITSARITKATKSDMETYYQNHLNLYSIPKMIEVTQYTSKSKQDLAKMINNPMLNIAGINKEDDILKSKQINPRLLFILQQTKEGNFTPILTFKNSFASFYIKRKIDVTPIPFEKVENNIFAKIMNQREKDIIKSYFDKLISEANIKIIRTPQ